MVTCCLGCYLACEVGRSLPSMELTNVTVLGALCSLFITQNFGYLEGQLEQTVLVPGKPSSPKQEPTRPIIETK